MQLSRLTLLALLATALCGCQTPLQKLTAAASPKSTAKSSGVTRDQLAEIFLDRRSKGAMVSIRLASPTEYAIDFATPEPPLVGTQYRYETFNIRKDRLDLKLANEIHRVAIPTTSPGG